MIQPLIRILSDLHFGDRASAVISLASITPLLDGPAQIVLNGDTLDTRTSRDPAATAALRAEVERFFASQSPMARLVPGNHDPDISTDHALEFAERRIFVTHGDILFDDLVPWSRDAAVLRQRVAAEIAKLPPHAREQLGERLAAYHRAAASIPQRHQAERHGLKYAIGFAADTVWPPTRVFRVLRAWREAPVRAAALVQRHGLPAKFFIMGHTHRLGAARTPDGLIVLNTGSFCPPGAVGLVDITADRLMLRKIERRSGEFHPGAIIAEFALAGS